MFMNSFQMIHLTDSKSSVTRWLVTVKKIPFYRGSSQPRGWIQVSYIAGGFFIQVSYIAGGFFILFIAAHQKENSAGYKGSPRILKWVAYPFSSRSPLPRNWTRISCIADRFFTDWAIREAQLLSKLYQKEHVWETAARMGWTSDGPLEKVH